ncbi:MAG: M15 family metallopeptidase [Elusimicrobia bacterium]|nr:M15 family metallopeptidase [Elusimicrobiota bacterium]
MAEPITIPPLPLNLEYSRDIRHCHPFIQERWPKVLEMYRAKTGVDLFITCTWRSLAYQAKLYAQGRTTLGHIVTWTLQGKHNLYPSHAFDVAVDVLPSQAKVKVSWDFRLYEPLIAICKLNDLVSGGSWNKKDWPHIEMDVSAA